MLRQEEDENERTRGKIKTPFMLAFSVGVVLFSAHAGGGKAIDTCKVLAHSTNRPFFTFPTIASTCASCTSLGIVYHPDGSLREYSFSKIPPNHIFINTQIIAEAPDIYLWAGMGDTMVSQYCQAQKKTVIFTARLFSMVSLLC